MTTPATIQVLIEARKLIEKPENWGQGVRGRVRSLSTCCAAEAIEDASDSCDLRMLAFRRLYKAAGLNISLHMLTKWNDDPKRTHAEVLAAFDKAIAAERAKVSA